MAIIFEGNYQNFDEIMHSDEYDTINMIPRFYELGLSRYQHNYFFPDPIPNEYNHIRDITSMCIAMLCAESKEMVNILDIGGGFGVSYIELIKRTLLKNFNYTVCETNSFYEYYQANPFFKEKKIIILNSLEKISLPYQFLIFGSVLQYFEDYETQLKNIITQAQFPNYILMTHTPITNFSTFATAQVNMSNRKIPNWIFNIHSLLELFKKNGYECLFRSAIYREALFDDFKEQSDHYRSANCLFK